MNMKEKQMTNKQNQLGILLILAVFCACVSGCSTTPNAYYYNLGDVSEGNCALIDVSVGQMIDAANYKFLESDYPYSAIVKINGQGNAEQWPKPAAGLFGFTTRAIVRVTPGVHTFTITLFFDDNTGNYELPLDVTYDCKAGKGYSFDFRAQDGLADRLTGSGFFTGDGSKLTTGFIVTTIIINEHPLNEQGSVAWLSEKEVGRKTEDFVLNSDLQRSPGDTRQTVDRERLVKRQN